MDTRRNTWWYGVIFVTLVSVCDLAKGNMWRKSLEKELLHHTIRYLRDQLVGCLKTSDAGRGKRKADYDASHWLAELELQMDIDILQNTQAYLMDRVVHCRKRTDSSRPHPLPQPSAVVDGIYKAKVEKYLPLLENSPVNDVPAAGEGAAVVSVGKEAREPEVVLIPDIAEITTRVISTPTTESTMVTSKTQTEKFVLDGKSVTCDVFTVKGTAFQCLNLWVDGQERLPNKDFCPPTYDPDRWRPVADMSSRTRDVIDLLNLCAVLGQHMMIPGYSKDVRVVWGCGDIKTRPKWQNGRWDGYIEDNGFLHDLMCVYSADVVWPRP